MVYLLWFDCYNLCKRPLLCSRFNFIFFAIIEREIFVQQNDKITQTHYEYFVLHFSVEIIFWFSAGQKKIPRFNLCNFSHHCNEEIKHTFLDTFTFFSLSLSSVQSQNIKWVFCMQSDWCFANREWKKRMKLIRHKYLISWAIQVRAWTKATMRIP